jgi:hypothetical protein
LGAGRTALAALALVLAVVVWLAGACSAQTDQAFQAVQSGPAGQAAPSGPAAVPAPDRERLLRQRVCDLGLTVEGSPRLARAVRRLYAELDAAGISLRPPVYLTDEWGCPDRVPMIGIPFYLADERLAKIQDEAQEGIEGGSDEEIMRYLRHEAGHAFNYAYRLYDDPEWTRTFGPFSAPYSDAYTPDPFSREFVRHLPGWYAQKHPDEDFAETFAVWLTPGSDWRRDYRGWGAYAKLRYVDRAATRLGRTGPVVAGGRADVPVEELCLSVEEFARRFRPETVALPADFDADLRDIFPGRPAEAGRLGATAGGPDAEGPAGWVPASRLLAANRRTLVGKVGGWTGLDDTLVRSLVEHLIARSRSLDLWVEPGRSTEKLVEVTAYVTALSMNRLATGAFVGK